MTIIIPHFNPIDTPPEGEVPDIFDVDDDEVEINSFVATTTFNTPSKPPTFLPPLIFSSRGNLIFSGNKVSDRSRGFTCTNCIISTSKAKFEFVENHCQQSSHLMLVNNAVVKVNARSFVNFSYNVVQRDSSTLLSLKGLWSTSPDSKLLVTENVGRNGFSVLFFFTTRVLL